jgi:ABC-type branched-subunit amino acid transport system substrate-binding protein
LIMAAQDLKYGAGGGDEIQLIVKDSGGEPNLAAAAVRELVLDHKVAAIVGPLSRVAAEAAAREAQKLWIPIITLTQKEGVSEIGNYVLRSFLSNEQQTRALVNYAVHSLDCRRFAILYPDDSYGTSLVHMFWDELDRLGAEVRGVEAYAPSQTDFADEIRKLVGLYYQRPEIAYQYEQEVDGQVASDLDDENGTNLEEEILPIVDFDAIFIPDRYSQVGLIAPQLAYHDVTGVRLLGTNLWNSPKLVEMAAPYLQQAVFVDGFFAASNLSPTRRFVQRYQAVFGDNPGYPEAQAYDTLRLLAAALRQPGVTSRPLVLNALFGINEFPGVAGTASVSANGEIHKPPFLITIEGRRMEEVQVELEGVEISAGESVR